MQLAIHSLSIPQKLPPLKFPTLYNLYAIYQSGVVLFSDTHKNNL